MGTDQMRPGGSSSLLGALRRTVKKVRFLLSFSATRWILSSIAGSNTHGGVDPSRRRFSFGSRQPSLLDATAAEDDDASPSATYSRTASLGTASSAGTTVSRTSSGAASELITWRSPSPSPSSVGTSSPGPDDEVDIDRRAEQFIANFHRHIQMERQVSLELRYCREGSLERSTTPPISFR